MAEALDEDNGWDEDTWWWFFPLMGICFIILVYCLTHMQWDGVL